MAGKLDPKALPGRGKVRDDDQQNDGREGLWSKQERVHMDEQFCRALGSSLQHRSTDSDKRR
jgi:hypothetical protein